MITYKPIVIAGGRRKDGTWPVKIRVTFKGVARRLPTTLVCTDADLTRGGKIKNATILEKANELISRMRACTMDLSPFTIQEWDVDRVVQHIRGALSVQSFQLDFFTFADKVLKSKIPHTRNYYYTALNALEGYLGRRSLDVNEITRRLLLDFAASVGEVKAARHLAKLSFIFNEARNQYNDEDAGLIMIPRMPFSNMPKIQHLGKGQHSISQETMQRIISSVPANEYEAVALAAFVVSFGLMGANLADMYEAKLPSNGIWHYHRRKTGTEAKVLLEPKLGPFMEVLRSKPQSPLLFPELRRWGTPDTATHNINKWLRIWAEREGLEPFTFYAARKTWATLARRLGVEKATVDEALAHVGDFKITDIYAERNWQLAWDANRKVLDLFSWPDHPGASAKKLYPPMP